jgi:Kef-type K+ transport system membrane component KefB
VTLLLIACFAAVMLLVVRPAVTWWTGRSRSILSDPVPIAFALAMGSAWVTASLGLQPVFGAFLAGLAMRPRSGAPDADVLRAMDKAGSLLLPLFFVVTGLSLDVGTLPPGSLVLLALILVIAAAGKLGPAYAVSRACGLERRPAATVAALVNTRGLTELIVLNVGLDDGLISQRLFTILVLMALITTMMTGPALAAIRPASAPGPDDAVRVPAGSARPEIR